MKYLFVYGKKEGKTPITAQDRAINVREAT